MTTTKKTNGTIFAGRDIAEIIELISSLDSDEAIGLLLSELIVAREENEKMCDELINSNDQLIDFLSCEDWEEFKKIKECYNTGEDWHKLRDYYKCTLELLKVNTRRLNGHALSNNLQINRL